MERCIECFTVVRVDLKGNCCNNNVFLLCSGNTCFAAILVRFMCFAFGNAVYIRLV
ncbi:MAG TPA: hypothetical protein PLB72_04085 [Bacteroidia bacterium]|nr:hypothetical protein [Bacteroidia bacterium]